MKIKKGLYVAGMIIIMSSCGPNVEEIINPKTGQLELRYEYYLDPDGQKIKDGELVEWYPNGKKRLVQNYVSGILEGESIFYKNLDTIAYNNYENNKLHGKCEMKNSKGIVFARMKYKEGFLDGLQEYFYHTGTRKCIGEYIQGISEGKWSYFDSSGRRIGDLNNTMGFPKELVGTWTVNNKKEVFYTFSNDGTFRYYAPLFKYGGNPTKLMEGLSICGQKLELLLPNGRPFESFELKSISSNEFILLNDNTEKETWTRKN